jgi:PKD repeat protein
MFTDDQVLAMQAVLNSSTAQRNNLWTDGNLIATGTEDTVRTPCAPNADFYSTSRMTCVGTSIPFHDISSKGTVTSRTWTFQEGTPSSSSEKDPEVSFTSPGWKTITLEVSNAEGTNSITQTNYVFVSNDAGMHSPGFFENFEDPNSFTNDWVVFNPEGNSSKFSRVTTVGYNSSSCIKLNNDNNMNGDRDQLVSPSYDLSSGGSLFLNFRYSCASSSGTTANINDALTIYSSTDCGKTWLMRTVISQSTLANVGFVSATFTPTSSAQWVGKTMLIPTSLFQPNVRFKFEYKTNGFGNNFYIDDINVSNYPVGIDDPDASLFDLNIFPNPVSDGSAAIVNMQAGTNVSIRIFDMQGKTINVLYNGWLSEGEHHFDLNASRLNSKGMYLILVDDGITVQQKKFVVQ